MLFHEEHFRASLTSYLITIITDTVDSKAQKAYAPPPYPQIIPAPSHKHPHAPLHSAGPRTENLGLTSIPPLIFELYYLKSCYFTINLKSALVDDTGRPDRFE